MVIKPTVSQRFGIIVKLKGPLKKLNNGCFQVPDIYQVVVSNIFYFQPYLGKWSNLTHIFQMGWFNHQLVIYVCFSPISGLGLVFPTDPSVLNPRAPTNETTNSHSHNDHWKSNFWWISPIHVKKNSPQIWEAGGLVRESSLKCPQLRFIEFIAICVDQWSKLVNPLPDGNLVVKVVVAVTALAFNSGHGAWWAWTDLGFFQDE